MFKNLLTKELSKSQALAITMTSAWLTAVVGGLLMQRGYERQAHDQSLKIEYLNKQTVLLFAELQEADPHRLHMVQKALEFDRLALSAQLHDDISPRFD